MEAGDDVRLLARVTWQEGPRENAPALVLVHGSGPQDRDETIGGARPFKDIAEGLAEKGIAALRYEKRTKAHPEAFDTKNTTVMAAAQTDSPTPQLRYLGINYFK